MNTANATIDASTIGDSIDLKDLGVSPEFHEPQEPVIMHDLRIILSPLQPTVSVKMSEGPNAPSIVGYMFGYGGGFGYLNSLP